MSYNNEGNGSGGNNSPVELLKDSEGQPIRVSKAPPAQGYTIIGQEEQQGFRPWPETQESSLEVISSEDPEVVNSEESTRATELLKLLQEKVIVDIDPTRPETFATYGSAEKYYRNAFAYIQNSYPYDGSQSEKLQWFLTASSLDIAILQKQYPRSTGSLGFSSQGWGEVEGTAGVYAKSTTPEYVKFSGGVKLNQRLDPNSGRANDLTIDPIPGNAVEFWMKKSAFASAKTEREVIIDICTDQIAEGAANYGRLNIAATNTNGPFKVSYYTGDDTGFVDFRVDNANAQTSVTDGTWHHYAFVFSSSSAEPGTTILDFYLDGGDDGTLATHGNHERYKTDLLPTRVEENYKGAIGALGRDYRNIDNTAEGYGQFSGSLDDVRFWKKALTAEEVNSNFAISINGATDEEEISSILGLYYRFNEPITGNTIEDQITLDYSGRANNGLIVGYKSSMRSNSSAITTSADSITLNSEGPGDPIMNPNAPQVKEKILELVEVGKLHDKRNNSSLFKTVPQWAFDHTHGSSDLDSDFSILLQAIAYQFDNIRLLIGQIPTLELNYRGSPLSTNFGTWEKSY